MIPCMARPYSRIGILKTRPAEGTDGWVIPEGMRVPYAPDVIIPIAFDPTREYRIHLINGEWVVDVRAGAR